MKLLILLLWISLCVAIESSESLHKTSLASRTPRRGIPGLPMPAGLRPILSLLGLLSLPISVMGNVIPRLTQLIQNIPRPGSGGGGGLFQLPGLGGRPLGGRPLSSRPLASLLGAGSSSVGSVSAAGSAAASGASSAAGSAATTGGSFFFRRSTEALPWDISKIINKVKDTYKKYQMDNPECQRLLVCEIYRRSISIKMGNIADKFLRMLGAESRLDKSSFSSSTKTTLKDFLKAAQHGLTHKDCSIIYFRCVRDGTQSARSRDENYPLNKEHL